MFRYRRYRVFLVFAFITVLALYEFGGAGSSWNAPTQVGQSTSKERNEKEQVLNEKPVPHVVKETKQFDAAIPPSKTTPVRQTPPIVRVTRPGDGKPKTPISTPKPTPVGAGGPENDGTPLPGFNSDLVEVGQAKLEVTPLPPSIEPLHWVKMTQHFPVPSNSIIALPTGPPKKIPKIQFTFKEESAAAKADRESKLSTIKGVFKRSWDGYRKFAWLQDELKPVSGTYKNPFANWGATLVDTLDTLWIMGLQEEFEEAVEAVDKIDFTTTPRHDIPLFETTIRYLGGFLAAYDLSGGKHNNLLTKAVELAELLISAFDTPNRMPVTYYLWRPDFASQPHRASNRVVLAEIGSLSLEFTRLSQITGDQKYYDAIARITDELELFQSKTRLPGMWPTYIDASGCKTPDWTSQPDAPFQAPIALLPDLPVLSKENTPPTATTPEVLSPGGNRYIPLAKPEPLVLKDGGANPTWVPGQDDDLQVEEPVINWGLPKVQKRQLDTEVPLAVATPAVVAPPPSISSKAAHPSCVPQGFASSSEVGDEDFTLGGMSDSTYEYLSKQYLLLGGQIEKYRTMFEMSMDAVKENLIFRPMVPNDDDILISGKLIINQFQGKLTTAFEAESAHLTCFAGGMFGMGAKIFNRPDDLVLAKKLTEGCVWSYNMTSTGIMPEAFVALPCESMENCKWNETRYWEVLDPFPDLRFSVYEDQMVTYNAQVAEASAAYAKASTQMAAAPTPQVVEDAKPTPTVVADTLDKRQLADLEDDMPGPTTTHASGTEVPPSKVVTEDPVAVPNQVLPVPPPIWSPSLPRTHDEYVKNTIQEGRLPPGVVRIKAPNYILRPEAIESVWYMYRITGDAHWREVGWQMFEAVNKHTTTKYGNSAIDDVTKTTPILNDEMESFWLAETMKYFYLLFAEESLISLDDWVLNTEAHPFKRPR
ncbi:glycoside hydrolase family 47 protein [Pleomassaria siparia CBS 279.74]|uniref:alpha-1,2-Mannosidase n=1 Tax=Pleomassaria siparia CBS 279.74 TaxID=1314801 RepID=A0A6G1JQ90_9PLEO|nr:glycoside hydrolase family 47 protein [Pleomassaria siparia CBS 279.74]